MMQDLKQLRDKFLLNRYDVDEFDTALTEAFKMGARAERDSTMHFIIESGQSHRIWFHDLGKRPLPEAK